MRYIVIILVIALFAILGVVTLSNLGSNSSNKPSTIKSTKITDAADKNTTRLTWTEQGKLVGDDKRKSVRIIVTHDKRTIQLLSGYNDQIEKSEDFTNSDTAFDTFSRALDLLNFGRERKVKQSDERAACPFGNRFIYNLDSNNTSVVRSWSDSCSAGDGTFGGNATSATDIRRLFQAQIPDYTKFISGTQL